MLVYNLPGE